MVRIRGAFPRRASGDMLLSRRFTFGSRLTLWFYRGVLPSVHACLFSFVRKKETVCGILRSYSAGSRSPFVRSRGVGAVICLDWFTSGLCVYLWRSRRGYGETWNGGARLAARCLCAFARAHWPCRSFRGEYAGAARPRLRQRVFDSLDSLHAAAGLRWCVFAAHSLGARPVICFYRGVLPSVHA